jgi:hypothetical protein
MLYVGLDLSRKRLDYHASLADGGVAAVGACPPDRDGLAYLVHGLGAEGPVLAAIESMSGARFVHDQLELAGWDVRIADARRVKGLAPLACKTDRIDAWVLAELATARPSARWDQRRDQVLVGHRATAKPPVDHPAMGHLRAPFRQARPQNAYLP